jgi:polar amino acid transport system substrate-binding protein
MRLLTAIVVSVFLAANVYADGECIIKLRVNDSPPSYFKDSSGNWTGFVVEQGTAVITEAGCKAEYRRAPWGRGMRLLEEGKIDLMGIMSITEERKKFAHFIGPHYSEIIRLVMAKDSNYHIEKHEDLKNLPQKIMLELGTFYGEEMERLLKDKSFNKNIQWTSQVGLTPPTIEKITLGRVSGFLSYVTPGALKKLTQEVKYHPFVINADPVYFGVSKKSVDPLILKRLQDAVERLKASGEFEKILKKYE